MNFSIVFTILLISLLTQTPSALCLRSSDAKKMIDGTKLIVSLESGDTAVIRTPRDSDRNPPQADTPMTTADNQKLSGGGVRGSSGLSNEKRSKNGGGHGGGGGGNRKMNRNHDVNAANINGGRNKHHMEKKPLNSGEQHHHQGGKRRQFGNRPQIGNGNGNGKGNDQMKVLKSRKHQENQGQGNNKRNNNHNKSTNESGENGGKAQSTCRYTKSAWSECDSKTNTHSRTLTLKRGDSNCLPARTIQKKCKKACRYEKGTWSECKDSQMTRIDKLKTTTTDASTVGGTIDSTCEAMRLVKRKCNPDGNAGKSSSSSSSSSKSHQNGNGKSNKKERKNKEKANNRGTQQT